MPASILNPSAPVTAAERNPGAAHALALACVLAIGAGLRLVHLDEQLWIDEISALTGSIVRPAGRILTEWPGAASHVLYEFLAHWSYRWFGSDPWTIRLPAALFGVADIWMLHRLARRVQSARVALLSAALLAVSSIHVLYSQNARGYTALIFFFLLATDRLVRIDRQGEVGARDGLIWVGAGALAAWSQIFGVVILPAQAAAALCLRWARGRGAPPRQILAWASFGTVLIGLLYAPFVGDVLGFVSERAQMPGEGEAVGVGLVLEAVEGLAAGFGGLTGLAAAAAVGLVGVWSWIRRSLPALVFLTAPILLQLAIFVALDAAAHPRYFAVALPTLFLVGGTGLDATAERMGRWLLPERGRERVVASLLAVLVAASALPLLRYYRYPKQDFLGAIHYVEQRAAPGDLRLGATVAGHVIQDFYGAPFQSVENLAELRAAEAAGRPVWLVVTLERLVEAAEPELMDHVRAEYERVAFLPGIVGDGHMRVYYRTVAR